MFRSARRRAQIAIVMPWVLSIGAGVLYAALRRSRAPAKDALATVPRAPGLDHTLSLFVDPYRFISTRCKALGTDVFQTRIMLRKAFCAVGEEAARVFYHPDRFTRRGAMPITALKLLQDHGSVAVLDGEAHRHRKQMFLSLMTPARLQALADAVEDGWRAQVGQWESMREVVLSREVQKLLCREVCAWAGVPLEASEVGQRTRELVAMFEGAGAVGPQNWRGQLLRARTERWLRGVVRRVRAGELSPPEASALHAIAWYRGLNGELLDPEDAAVEIINVLRPTVAIERYVTFAALALHEHPEQRERLLAGDDKYLEMFVQEVRRFYPFFPAVGGRAKSAFDWRGHHFPEGSWILLDLYGTNHDARVWAEPDTFQPERFRDWDKSAFNFIPQGGGDHHANHRCAGEWLTIEILKRAVRMLAAGMSYEVPTQDLRIDMHRAPAELQSGFVIRRVRRIQPSADLRVQVSP